MTIVCDHCHRRVPVSPGRYRASVPHVRVRQSNNVLAAGFDLSHVPCTGNAKRAWLEIEHPSNRLAQQYTVLDEDQFWEDV